MASILHRMPAEGTVEWHTKELLRARTNLGAVLDQAADLIGKVLNKDLHPQFFRGPKDLKHRTRRVKPLLQQLLRHWPKPATVERAEALALYDGILLLEDQIRQLEISRSRVAGKATAAERFNKRHPTIEKPKPDFETSITIGETKTDKPPKPPPKTPSPKTGGGGGEVVRKVGEAAGEPKLYTRVAAKIGIQVLDGLVPDPIDAFELMIMVLNSYEEAREAIRERNLRNGFAVGWAAYLIVPRWEWAKWFAYTEAFSRHDVFALVLGAVGVKENAFNEGLVRGFIYGEKHSTAQANRARRRAFDQLVAQNRMPWHVLEEHESGYEFQFGREDVWAFASVMRPAADEVLKEAERRKAARERVESAAREKKQREREDQRLEAEVLSTR